MIGTHGRSIFILPLTDVRALTDSLRKSPIAFLHAEPVNYQASWGKRPDEFSDPSAPSAAWTYFVQSSGTTRIRLISKAGVLLKEVSDSAEAGVNYVTNDLSLDGATAKKLEAECRKSKKDAAFRILPGKDDGKYYLVPGDYKLTFTDAHGHSVEGKFEVKDPSAKKESGVPDPESVGPPGK
ncbi:MAG TPA: hypothetical protein PLI08_11725 [Bacteroidia bacterium]|nr:hypothetical protein [Bacteroidia bacterium]